MCKIGFYRFFLFIFLLIDVHYVNSKKQVKYKQSKQIQPTEVREINDESIEKTDVKVPTGPQTLSFTPGNLTDEDFHSLHMPQDLLCDGCITVAYVITQKLNKVQGRYPQEKGGHRMTESDLVDFMDNICKDKEAVFNGLQDLCYRHVDEIGEEVIYANFITGKSIAELLCFNNDIGVVCKKTKILSEEKLENLGQNVKGMANDKSKKFNPRQFHDVEHRRHFETEETKLHRVKSGVKHNMKNMVSRSKDDL